MPFCCRMSHGDTTEMNQREAVLATLRRERTEFVPRHILFSTPQSEDYHLPDVRADDPLERQILRAAATGDCFLDVHGNLRPRLVEEDENHQLLEFENGTLRRVTLRPEWFYDTLSRPLDAEENLDKLHLPDVRDPERWTEQKRAVETLQPEGRFIRGTLNGFYSGIWYYCRKLDKFLVDLMDGEDFVYDLVHAWGTFVLGSARALLECGVDGIWWADDLGSNEGPIISPDLYREYFFPWHKRAADLAHEYGAVAMMHSHGNINKLVPHIVETGIDLLDPVGPSDRMDVAQLKQQYGDRLSFLGGISRFIGDMPADELRDHMHEVYGAGCPGGGFIPSEEGGVPRNMPRARFREYLELHRQLGRSIWA